MKKFLVTLAGAAALVAGTSAQAATKLWTIHDAVFNDGGTWTGSFEYDAATGEFGSYSWTTSGGDTTDFPPLTYNNANAVNAPFFSSFDYDGAHVYLYAFSGPTDYPDREFRSLYLSTVKALGANGGTVGLNLTSTGYTAGECHDCAPYRPLVSGYLTADVTPGGVPEPANWALMIGGIGIVGMSGRYARRKVSVAYA